MRRAGPLAITGLLLVAAGCAVPPPVAAPVPSGPTPVSAPAVVTSAPATSAPPTAEQERVTVPLANCRPDQLPTVTPGVLTLGAVGPFTSPLFEAAPPAPGGLNGALALEIGLTLGYSAEDVTWVSLTAADATARLDEVDAAFGRWTVPDRPDGATDHSSGYLSLAPVLVTLPGDELTRATRIADLDGVLVAVVGTQPVREATPDRRWFNSTDAALAAVRAGQVRAAVVDQLAAETAADLVSVARVPADEGWQPPQLAARLAGGSPITACLSAAVDLLRVQGTLDDVVASRIDLPELS